MNDKMSAVVKARPRLNLGSSESQLPVPNLIGLQLKSYNEDFLQLGVAPSKLKPTGLHAEFTQCFPIHGSNITLEYDSYTIDEPTFSEHECKIRGRTYSAALRAKLRLIYFDQDEDGAKQIREVKEQEVYVGDIPCMTDVGSFIINGTERVVVAQLYRSPGVSIEHDSGKTHSSGKLLYSARIIPYRGAWIDLEFDVKDIVSARIDRRKKLPVTVLLKAMGYSSQAILEHFFEKDQFSIDAKKIVAHIVPDRLKGKVATQDICLEDGTVICEKGTRIWVSHIRKMKKVKLKSLEVDRNYLIGLVSATPIVNESTGELIAQTNTVLTEELIEEMITAGVRNLEVLYINDLERGGYISDTLMTDSTVTQLDAWVEIYKTLRPGEPPTPEAAKNLFESLFYDATRYDLSHIGRMKLNGRFKLDKSETLGTLEPDDVLAVVKSLVDTRDGIDGHTIDDIDNLSNRRVRCVGEMVANQFRIAMSKVNRTTLDRMSEPENEGRLPQDFFNSKPIVTGWRELFSTSQLSQYMERGNPLALITHLRRISALGQGGLDRTRATIDVRDVHASHYGRICPIETPEGQNIGLINSLAVYSDLNKYGFMVTPFLIVKKGVVTSEITYLAAHEEYNTYIAQAHVSRDKKGKILDQVIECRYNGDYTSCTPDQLGYIEVATNQPVSVAASLIPFLEHDDANRALMGSNMQRQAVPTLHADKPLIGTGMERLVASDSGVSIVAKRSGVVESVDSSRIVIRTNETSGMDVGVDVYRLTKFFRSNQNTCINQRPIINVGQVVEKGDILTDGAATDLGELALGQNMLVAFLSWNGYNFEDSIILSERVAQQDRFTSVHIEEFQCIARDTKLGSEEVTADIPNIGETSLAKLDEAGIAYVGAKVEGGDILVGKITPKGETQLTPEEKLLRAIFGEKASDVKDSSLRVPAGKSGTVVDVKVFTRDGVKKDQRALQIEAEELEQARKDLSDELQLKSGIVYNALRNNLKNKVYKSGIKGKKSGDKMTAEWLESFESVHLANIASDKDETNEKTEQYAQQLTDLQKSFEDKLANREAQIKMGDELAPGVIKIVKVFLATTRRVQPGDKMAGRHGNKGCVSTIIPVEDMPYLDDGTPIDVILNPLGVPSRMNVGQILEVHLGWAAKGLGHKIRRLQAKEDIKSLRTFVKDIYQLSDTHAVKIDSYSDEEFLNLVDNLKDGVPMSTPVFDGAKSDKIKDILALADLPESGQAQLYDGRTGRAFDQKSTVGYMYMLKLNHLVDDKMHARSTGSYSLVTQQPLSGKAQFGGQRFGEMEVWALEAYGAAHTLQEMLTVKSDDVMGRTRMYKNIVDGNYKIQASIPESFNVLVKEIMALGIKVSMNDQQE
ncbi:DNA-directed RNA polymerase subunit beta [Gammaproteobacteria bacterium]|nr:DNA-directed RNA polymerase subunit beta [Gammaproteobacteria bacterium]